jgi:hypothetical protein
MVEASEVVQVARRHRLGTKASRYLQKFAKLGESAPFHEVMGVPFAELPRLNDALVDVTDLRKSVSEMRGLNG